MIRDTHNTTAFFTVRLLWLVLLIAPLCLFPTSQPCAQDNNILIMNEWKDYNIAHYTYITHDPDQTLTPTILMNRYKSNLRGTKTYSDIIKMSNARDPIWIIFTVYNKTPIQDWILDFGNSLTGRMGMIKQINILNHSTKQVLNFPAKEDSADKPKPDGVTDSPFVGSALSLDIQPGTQNSFIIRLEAQEGFPLVFNPRLVPQHNYMRQLMQGNIGHVIAAVLFISIGTFFIAAYYVRRNKSSLALASYYTILCAIFFNFSSSIVPHEVITGPILFMLYMASYLLLIMATRSFCSLKHHEKPLENIAFIAIGGLIVIGTLLYLSVMGTTATGLLLMSGLISICILASLAILFFLNERSLVNTLLFGTGSALSVFAFLLLALVNADIIQASSDTIASFWYIHLVQGLFFVTAYFHAGAYHNQKEQLEAIKRQRNDQSLMRLQKSKESADQARLIRVIERERELMAELREREVRRTEEMRIAKDSADKANHAKSAFLAVVSHEIRTPMNGILGMVQLLQKTTLSKSQTDYVETIHKSGDTMMALLNDILDFEKIESGSMTLEIINFDLSRLVNDVVILMSGHASQKNITLEADIDEDDVPNVVSGDPTRLRQVMLNLVNNAIKFTDEGSVIIKVERLSSENPDIKDKIRIAVKDTGIGISEEGISKLFTPFTQAESSTARKYGGTGLGLAISHRLIEAMESHITVHSVEGEGSTFFFDIDIIIQDDQGQDKDVPDEHFTPGKQAPAANPMSILVTEDNEMNRKVLDGLLSQQGHTLYMASNGLEALDICRKQKLDLVLMDIQMDGLNGLDTTRKLRAEPNPDIANIPVIAITGNVMLEDIQEFFEVGMNGFLAKPIDSNKLNEVIYNASIGKFENDPKRSDGQQTNTPKKIAKPAPTPKAQPHQNSEVTPPIATPKTADEPQQEDVTPSSPAIFDQTSEEEDTKKTGVDLSNIDTGLSLDDREHYISDSDLKSSTSVTTNGPLDNNDTSNFTFVDDKIQENVKDNDNDGDSSDVSYTEEENHEVTEIQRFLIERTEHNHINPEDPPKPEPVVSPDAIASPEVEREPKFEADVKDTPESNKEKTTPENNIPPDESAIEQDSISEAKKNDGSDDNNNIEEYLDINMLKQLLGTLGKDQFLSLLDGFMNKASEIVDVMETLTNEENLATLGSRAHELKGLSGNFGMKYLSNEAGEVEKAARMSRKEKAIKTAKGLRDINTQTQSILTNWAEEHTS